MFKVRAYSFKAGTAHSAVARANFPTAEAAAAVGAAFPKSILPKVGYTKSYNLETRTNEIIEHWVEIRVSLAPTAGNDRNETGIKRYRTFRRVAAKKGLDVEFDVPHRTIDNGWMTEEQFEAAIAE